MQKEITQEAKLVKISLKYGRQDADENRMQKQECFGYFSPPATKILSILGKKEKIIRYNAIMCPIGDWEDHNFRIPKWGIEIDTYEEIPFRGIIQSREINQEDTNSIEKRFYKTIRIKSNCNDSPEKWREKFGGVIAYNLDINEKEIRVQKGIENFLDGNTFYDGGDSYAKKVNDLLDICKIIGIKNPTEETLKEFLKEFRKE